MKYFYDTEFIEDGKTIDLISIGIIAEDGRGLYAQNREADLSRASDWVRENVLSRLKNCDQANGLYQAHCHSAPKEDGIRICNWANCPWRERIEIKEWLRRFVGDDPTPEFWGYYSAYDHVALCQLFGTMMDLPKGWPYYTRDLRQWADSLGITKPLDQFVPAESEHHALADAKWNRKAWEYVENQRIARTYGGISHGG